MQIGDWQIDSIVSGRFRLDGGAMFGVVPKQMWQRVCPADEENRIQMAMRLLVVRGHGKTILVDTGAGFGYGDKLTRIYAFDSNVPMDEALEPLGLGPDDITDLVITHLHFDHAGGAATPEGDGWRLTFPNAIHHIQKLHWEHALNPNPRDRASFFRERIEIIEREDALALYDGEWSLAPGFDLAAYHGHTPAQQLPKIGGGGETLFYCGDLVPTTYHLPTPYVMAYDLQPVVSMEEKVKMLTKAAAEGWILFFEHDAGVAACRVVEENGRFRTGEPISFESR